MRADEGKPGLGLKTFVLIGNDNGAARREKAEDVVHRKVEGEP